eukprot:gene13701-16144_t
MADFVRGRPDKAPKTEEKFFEKPRDRTVKKDVSKYKQKDNRKRDKPESEIVAEAASVEGVEGGEYKQQQGNKNNNFKKVKKEKIESDDPTAFEVDDKENLFADDYLLLKQKKSKLYSTKTEGDDKLEAKRVESMKKKDVALTEKQEKDAAALLPFLPKWIPKEASRLMVKNYSTGMVVLAAFELVTGSDITLSLPFGLKGYVKFNEISDEFTEWSTKIMTDDVNYKSYFEKSQTISARIKSMFLTGQFIKTSVIGITEHSRGGLMCSLRPEMVNSGNTIDTYTEGMNIFGCVESVQDRGYVISFGKDYDFKGFLETKNTKHYWPVTSPLNEQETQLFKGMPVECAIIEIDKETRRFILSAAHPLVARNSVVNTSVVTMESIKAGMLVDTKVVKIINGGLHVSFLEFFTGDLHILHCEKDPTTYAEDSSLKARILYVDQVEKKIGLSNLIHTLGLKPFPFAPVNVGHIFKAEDCPISYVTKNELIVKLPVQNKVKAYLHLKESESKSENLKQSHKIGENLLKDCRVKHLDYIEGAVTLTLKTAELKKQYFSYYDLCPGMIVDGTIKNIRDSSLEVELSQHIYGAVPEHSMGETIIRDTRKKFTIGQTVRARVLSVIPENRRCVLTLKPSLINSNLMPLISYDSIIPGVTLAHGFITKIVDNAFVFVSFYGNAFGSITKSQLSRVPVALIDDQFKVGQVVLTKVLGQNKNGLDLTLILEQEDFDVLNQANKGFKKIVKEDKEEEVEETPAIKKRKEGKEWQQDNEKRKASSKEES